MRLRVTLLAAVLVAFGASSASAATFTQTPPATVTTSSGPFVFAWRTDNASRGEATAWKRSDESTWHRCVAGNGQATIPAQPAGTFTFDIADDVNVNYEASQGQLYSGRTQECMASPPPPPQTQITRFTLTITDPAPPPSPVPPPTTTTAPAPAPLAPVAPAPTARSSSPDCTRARRLVTVTLKVVSRSRAAVNRRSTRARRLALKRAKRKALAALLLRDRSCG